MRSRRNWGTTIASTPDYSQHVHSVKHQFLRRNHQNLLEGPLKIKETTGSLLIWEQGLEDFYVKYDEKWNVQHFGGSVGIRRPYAHAFLVAQAKKARAEIVEERKRVALAAKKAQERPLPAQRARGSKRARIEPSCPSHHHLSPSRRYSSPHRFSESPRPSYKRHRGFEKPNVRFKDFALILKVFKNPPTTSYDAVL